MKLKCKRELFLKAFQTAGTVIPPRTNHEILNNLKLEVSPDGAELIGTDLEVGILKGVCAFRRPVTVKIDIFGDLKTGVYAKDIILSIIGRIGVDGATDRVIEFSGPVVEKMTMEERMTLCNMAVEFSASGTPSGRPSSRRVRT